MLAFITWNVDPILFHIGNGGIRWYGLLWAIGIYVCWKINERMYKQENCPPEWADQLFFWITIGTILGSRLGHCLFYEWHLASEPVRFLGMEFAYRNPFLENPIRILYIWEGGLASHGGAIGIILSAWLLNKYKFSHYPQFQTSWLWILDRLCIGACITGALIRLGNLFNSEIYGAPTTMPWGFIFVNNGETVPCHPTQIYEMIYCLVTFAVTYPLYKYTQARRREGLLIGIFLVMVFGTRFALEFIKNTQEEFENGHLLDMGQILSIPFIALGIYLIIRAYRRALLPVVEKQPESLDPKYRNNQNNRKNRK